MERVGSDLTATLIVLAIMGVIGMGINSAKGKSLGWGFTGGFIFGIFGWIFLALHGAPGLPCNRCKEKVKLGATVCKHCGSVFTVPAGSAG